MQISEAWAQSSVSAAFRPFYDVAVDPEMEKFIVVTGNGADVTHYQDAFIVYDKDKKYWRQLADAEVYKISRRDDWEPVAPGPKKA